MIQLDNLKMSKKMLILVIIGILSILCVGYIGITSSGTINAQLNELYEIKYIHTVQSEDALIELLQYAKGTSDYITEMDKEKMKEIENNTLEPAIQTSTI
ncbi:Four helix bundle sensory module for signal transduction [anaerobic digester metagenome]